MLPTKLPFIEELNLFVKPFIKALLIAALLLTFFRLGFVLWQLERISDAQIQVTTLLVQGFRFDLLVTSLYILPIFILSSLLSLYSPIWKYGRPITNVYLVSLITILVYLEIASPSFINEYDARPNLLFVEYLKYPKEVLSTLWGAYKLQVLLLIVVIPFIVFSSKKLLSKDIDAMPVVRARSMIVIAPVFIFLFLIMARSSFGHRPANPSSVAFSSDGLVNELSLNSLYTLTYALYESSKESDGGVRYGSLPYEKVIDEVRLNMGAGDFPYIFTSAEIPTLHAQQAESSKKKNLVIVLEESLGAEFVGSLGGLPLTPNLDSYQSQGIWFDNLYATGTRSVRGIEAVLTGFTPTSARSTVKLGQTQRNFFTLAQLLSQHGFDTEFIYGGDSNFDNMRRFFMNNGFSSVIDESDYTEFAYKGSWGVSDEDLFEMAHQRLVESNKQSKSTFKMIFTSSNHSPFEFPDGRIKLFDKEKSTVNNAVKYADHALGQFIRKAQSSDYWANTVFLIVSDHNSRVYGETILPIERFHIPGVILGEGIQPKRIAKITSQIDLAPTVLSLIGVSSEHPMIGRDMLSPHISKLPGRAIMQFHSTQGYMQGNQVVIMRPDMKPQVFEYKNNQLLEAKAASLDLIEQALAISLWSSTAIKEKLYRLPQK